MIVQLLKKRFGIRNSFSIIFNLYIFVMIADPMREALDFSNIGILLSLLRDCFIFILFLIISLFKKIKNHSLIILLYFTCYINFLIISCFNVYSFSYNFSATFGILRGLMMCFVIINLPNFYVENKNTVIKVFANSSVIVFLLSLFIYFLHPELLIAKYAHDRISVGNSSIQSICFVCSFILIFYYKPFSKIKNFVYVFLLFLATLATVTSTAYVVLVTVFLFTVFEKQHRFQWIRIFAISIIFLLALVLVFNIDFNRFFKAITIRFEEFSQLISKYLSGNMQVQTKSQSFNIREHQIQHFFQRLKFSDIPLGGGIFTMSKDSTYLIENSYYAIFQDFGILGALPYLLFIVYCGFIGIRQFFAKKDFGLLLSMSTIALYSCTLYVFAGTNMMVQLFLFFYLTIWNDKYNFIHIKAV